MVRQSSGVRRRHVRLLLAVATAALIAGLSLGVCLRTGVESPGSQGGALQASRSLASEIGQAGEAGGRTGKLASAVRSPEHIVAVARASLSRPLRRLNAVPARWSGPLKEENAQGFPFGNVFQQSPFTDGALQTSPGSSEMPAPIQSIEGITNMCGCVPPDTEGDVGPNHYMQWVNLHYAI